MHNGQIFTRENLLEKVWGYEYYGDVRTVDVTVRRIRKAGRDTSNCEYILTKKRSRVLFLKSRIRGSENVCKSLQWRLVAFV